MASSELIFFVNGKKNVLSKPDPEMTLLQYLRNDLMLTGTKLGCGEGGCGACTVMLSTCSAESSDVHHMSANACLVPLCSLHGMAVTTVEGIGSLKTRLHPVQERIAAAHGSQCGFCTPGFVMSMYTLLRNNPTPSLEDLESNFDGNLCRCTGYRPILEGYRSFTKGFCEKGENCCMNKKSEANGRAPIPNGTPIQNGITENGVHEMNGDDEGKSNGYDPSQEPIFPPFLKMEAGRLEKQSLEFSGSRVTWYRPASLPELLDIKRKNPDCRIVIGNTELGIETKFKKQLYPVLVASNHVQELREVRRVDSGIQFGSAVTLATLDKTFKAAIAELPEEKTRVFAAFVEMLRWFGGHQIRNVAALGGNIMTASPISDLNPLLLASGATLELVKTDGAWRLVKMDGSFFTGYRKTAVQPSEILVSVLVPFSKQGEHFAGFKQAHRKEDDISIVNAGMRVELDSKAKVTDLALAFGGMAPTTVMAANTMKQLIGCEWNEDLLSKACDLLTSDLPLAPGSPGGMVQYRRTLTLSFFFKFYLSVLHKIHGTGNGLKPSDLIATQPMERQPTEGVQWYEVNPDPEARDSALRLPLVHESAYKQASGEAIYANDILPRRDELHLGLVLSTKARARIVRVDTSAALNMPGVVDFITHKDIPGSNLWGFGGDDYVFAQDEVMHQGQPIAGIIAETLAEAQRAAQAVVVTYEEMEPIITIEDAIKKNSFFSSEPLLMESGDVERALGSCQHVLEGSASVQPQEHLYLEPHAALAWPGEDKCMEVVSTSQCASMIQQFSAIILGIPQNMVKATVRRLGGAFGGKETRNAMVYLPAVVAAAKVGRPVRCALERDEDMMMTGTRHALFGKYKIGFNSDGKILAFDSEYYTNAGCSLDLSAAVLEKVLMDADSAYHIPNRRMRARACKTNLPSSTAFRGFGAPQTLVVTEDAINRVASFLNMPPEKVREVNLYSEGETTHYKQVLSPCNLRRCWDDVIKQSDFENKRREVDEFNSKNRWRKRGLALSPNKFGLNYYEPFLNQAGALVNVFTDGTVLISYGGVEMGQGLHTKMLQVASQVLQLPLSKITLSETSSSVIPNATATAASVSSDMYGAAIVNACQTLLKRLEPIRAKKPKCTWEELVTTAYLECVCLSATGHYKTPDSGYDFARAEGGTHPHNYFSYSAACSMIEIDCLTGDHQVLSTDIVFDVGKSLNPAIDVGQIEGGFVQGHGLYMLEQYKVRPDGTLLTRGPGAYKIPTLGNTPQSFNVTLLKRSENTRAVYSSKGVGEPPLLLACSVLLALHDAIRSARRDQGLQDDVTLSTPATPDVIRLACGDALSQRFEETEEEKKGTKPWFVQL